MAPSVSKEHLIRGSDPSLWGLSAFDGDDETQRLSSRIWTFMNGKSFNTVIVILVLIQSLVITGQLLIDFDLIQDPSFIKIHHSSINSTNVTNSFPTQIINNNSPQESDSTKLSPNLIIAKVILTYSSLILASIFFVEILLRIYSGKLKVLIQPFESLDALLVTVVFILNLIFFLDTHPHDNRGGREGALLIIILRLWRIHQIIQIMVEESQQRLMQILNVCEKEKSHSEHKIDILILKVEDLEHEVAYLKEKLKKTEKESSTIIQQLIGNGKNKKSAKRTESNFSSTSTASYCPCRKNSVQSQYQKYTANNYTSVTVEPNPDSLMDMDEELNDDYDLDAYARELAQSITVDVMSTVLSRNGNRSRNSYPTRMVKSQPSTADESGYNSRGTVSNNTSPASTNPHSNPFSNKHYSQNYTSRVYSDSSYFNDQLNGTQLSPQTAVPLNINSFNAAHHLNEDLEIERVKKVEFSNTDVVRH